MTDGVVGCCSGEFRGATYLLVGVTGNYETQSGGINQIDLIRERQRRMGGPVVTSTYGRLVTVMVGVTFTAVGKVVLINA